MPALAPYYKLPCVALLSLTTTFLAPFHYALHHNEVAHLSTCKNNNNKGGGTRNSRWHRTLTGLLYGGMSLSKKKLILKNNHGRGSGGIQSKGLIGIGPGHPQVSARHWREAKEVT